MSWKNLVNMGQDQPLMSYSCENRIRSFTYFKLHMKLQQDLYSRTETTYARAPQNLIRSFRKLQSSQWILHRDVGSIIQTSWTHLGKVVQMLEYTTQERHFLLLVNTEFSSNLEIQLQHLTNLVENSFGRRYLMSLICESQRCSTVA